MISKGSGKSKVIVVASGYFDPIHSGHVEYLQRSRELGDMLIVIVNNDRQACLKKGAFFMPAQERIKVVRALACVDLALESIDIDRSVCLTLAALHPHIFTNGGDQTNACIPEAEICQAMGISLVDGLGEKIQSSSTLIENAKKIKNYKNI
jgi:D-beta-D-heptose 7-phosphate kinase/D-beta-D-heptose 1-phosphate adenosyltransferase